MSPTLVLLLIASVPEPSLLEKLGERAVQLEAFANASRVTVEVVVEKFDAEGVVTKTTRTSLRVGRKKEEVDRKLLSFVENGKDLSESRRAELEAPPKKPMMVKSPFHPDQTDQYRFAILAPPPDQPTLMRLGFQPAGENTDKLYMGDATVDPQTGEVLTLSLRPSKNPPFVHSLSIEATLDAVTPAGRAMSSLTVKGVAGFLFIKERFRIVTTFKDYEPL